MYVNLTPHAINIYRSATDSNPLVIPPSGALARCAEQRDSLPELPDGIPVSRASFGAVEGLPAPVEGTNYIVSGLVLAALAGSGRNDVFAPGQAVRNETGQVVGCLGLSAVGGIELTDEMLRLIWSVECSSMDGTGLPGGWLWGEVTSGEEVSTALSPLARTIVIALRDKGATFDRQGKYW